MIGGRNRVLHILDAQMCIINITEEVGCAGSEKFGFEKDTLLDKGDMVNVLAGQGRENSGAYSVLIR